MNEQAYNNGPGHYDPLYSSRLISHQDSFKRQVSNTSGVPPRDLYEMNERRSISSGYHYPGDPRSGKQEDPKKGSTIEQHSIDSSKQSWFPNQSSTAETCYKCGKKFRLFNGRHTCKICLQSFCGKCSNLRMMKHERTIQKIRVCNDCESLNMTHDKIQRQKRAILNIDKKDYLDNPNASDSQHGYPSKQKKPQNQDGPEEAKDLTTAMATAAQQKSLDNRLKDVRNQQGIQAAQELLTKTSIFMKNQVRERQIEEEKMESERTKSFKRQRSSVYEKVGGAKSMEVSHMLGLNTASATKEQEDLQMIEEVDTNLQGTFLDGEGDGDPIESHMEQFLDDIRLRVMDEFSLDKDKWSDLLSDYIRRAIYTVRPWSFKCNDSIDITDYVKIQLINYKDTSKSKYVNGVVMKKSIAHNRMLKDIQNPSILLLSNSLGIQKDDEEFFDIDMQIKSDDNFIGIILKKIELVKPNIIFLQKDASMKAIQALLDRNITLVTNVKKSVMQRLERLTQTVSCPSTNLLDQDFITGKCEKFFMEGLAEHSTARSVVHNITNLITLDGCLPYLGCTIILSGQDMGELKLVKHALKKMLRLSRQLILEYEYLSFFGLSLPPFETQSQASSASQANGVSGIIGTKSESTLKREERTPYLHQKHMERQFLIFKEATFSKRGIAKQTDEEEEDPCGIKQENNIQANVSEQEVQSRIQMVCQSPEMKTVHFYSESHNDLSLECKLRSLCHFALSKCSTCLQPNMRHSHHFYHKAGYVEMKMRFSKDAQGSNPEHQAVRIRQSDDSPIFIQSVCEACKAIRLKVKPIQKQLREISFYSFLEQFFYNQKLIVAYTDSEDEVPSWPCVHSFHEHAKMIFMIDILRIEFQYHPVTTYELDLNCFKHMPGSLSQMEITDKFVKRKLLLAEQVEDTFAFIFRSCKRLSLWLDKLEGLYIFEAASNRLAKGIIKTTNAYVEQLEANAQEYLEQISSSITSFKASHEYYLNKVHKAIASRVSDYLYILQVLHKQIFEEFLVTLPELTPKEVKKFTKKEQMAILYDLMTSKPSSSFRRKKLGKHNTQESLPFDHLLSRGTEMERLSSLRNTSTRFLKPQGKQIPIGFNDTFHITEEPNESETGHTVASAAKSKEDSKELDLLSPNIISEKQSSKRSGRGSGRGSSMRGSSAQGSSDREQEKSGKNTSHSLERVAMEVPSPGLAKVDSSKLSSPGLPLILRTDPDIMTSFVDRDKGEDPDEDDEFTTLASILSLMDFEKKLKANPAIKEFFKMSPSIPNGFDMNCTQVNVDDFSTIICQALLSNEHMTCLKEQGYMNLDSKLKKYVQTIHRKNQQTGLIHQTTLRDRLNSRLVRKTSPDLRKTHSGEMSETDKSVSDFRQTGHTNESKESSSDTNHLDLLQKPSSITMEYQLFREDQDVMNKEISQKEIETELLRLEQYHYLINFNTFKGPDANPEVRMLLERITKTVKVDQRFLSNPQAAECLAPFLPEDLEAAFYRDLNLEIVQRIFQFKILKDQQGKAPHELQIFKQQEKYGVYALFYPKYDIGVKMYFPSHFSALRKLYCGQYNQQLEHMFQSSFWADNTGGKSKSDFYKSYNEKYVMKVINSNEMKMFCEFAQPYFEYMCRSFNQKCPTSIAKILGAYKIEMSNQKKRETFYVILMENLVLGMDPSNVMISKYDLKGSMSRRYVMAKGKPTVTRLDTNFLEDHNSMPICMNYTLHRLMEIAIHNDTSFLSRHEKIDYSFLVWIDQEQKLIRVGIIDYIQYYSFEKQLEYRIKKHILNTGKAPTIVNPESYKQRFKLAMSNYFMSILEDQPIDCFADVVKRQEAAKAKFREQQEIQSIASSQRRPTARPRLSKQDKQIDEDDERTQSIASQTSLKKKTAVVSEPS